MEDALKNEIVRQIVKEYLSRGSDKEGGNIVRIFLSEIEQIFVGYNPEIVLLLLDELVAGFADYVITIDKGNGRKETVSLFLRVGRDEQGYHFAVNKELRKI